MKQENQRIATKDGSHTLYVPELDETYHSRHGAIQESMHVFIEAGLKHLEPTHTQLSILELGFGTGLNAWLTAVHATKPVYFHSIEKYPVSLEDALSLNYPDEYRVENGEAFFKAITTANWEETVSISANFKLHKTQGDFRTASLQPSYDLIYWDVFGFRAQPDLWEAPLFQRIYEALKLNGCLVTYSSKGVVRRTMEAVGFEVEKLAGPPGKREMVRAWKR
jgi:tRNA U34 5-methylaminomethyl-2-thiouridine-forming methyltransferase MnmC